jgi:hypothetical protein
MLKGDDRKIVSDMMMARRWSAPEHAQLGATCAHKTLPLPRELLFSSFKNKILEK